MAWLGRVARIRGFCLELRGCLVTFLVTRDFVAGPPILVYDITLFKNGGYCTLLADGLAWTGRSHSGFFSPPFCFEKASRAGLCNRPGVCVCVCVSVCLSV